MNALHMINMKQNIPVLLQKPADFLYGLNGADFVIDMHDAKGNRRVFEAAPEYSVSC